MAPPREIEVKFVVEDLRTLGRRLKVAGFRRVTPSAHEVNTLYDLPSKSLRKRGEVLRLRVYGKKWTLTHKSKGQAARHKIRIENETAVANGEAMNAILLALGYEPSFRYEKFREEWSDGHGHVVLDETPIGDFGEIEGSSRWIDRTARTLGITSDHYITQSYVELFLGWKKRAGATAQNMTFDEVLRREL